MKFEYHVKPTGSDAACGDAEHPFATISKAAQVAAPGDTVIVHEGVYREQVDPKRGGLSEHERITYCGAEGEARPIIKGSRNACCEAGRNWPIRFVGGVSRRLGPLKILFGVVRLLCRLGVV